MKTNTCRQCRSLMRMFARIYVSERKYGVRQHRYLQWAKDYRDTCRHEP